ncbi:hypothetical protein [Rhodanobacter sp. A1T4]|uniref:hypothetical protein n=1 Tax=Rhodanobacter sp. A1T4 TaxID=2723087 RepID=UPI00160B19E6|nr:hypothetical protein [Rhodanobacter sp. A1T4]MBB6249160.1 hypothetical protein [Rhodanobacter sp. A1T4]
MKLVDTQPLEMYLDTADRLQAEVKIRQPEWFGVLIELDAIWRTELFGEATHLAPVPASIVVQSFYFWLAAVRVALSGHATAVYPLLRTGLEAACYAYKLVKDPTLTSVWLARDRNAESRKKCRQAFTSAVSEVAKLPEIDPLLGTAIREMYDACIDFGGHPNPRALFDHLNMSDNTGSDAVMMSIVGLNGPTSVNTVRALAAAAEHGFFAIIICANATGDHPRADTLQQRLDAVIVRVQALTKPYLNETRKTP